MSYIIRKACPEDSKTLAHLYANEFCKKSVMHEYLNIPDDEIKLIANGRVEFYLKQDLSFVCQLNDDSKRIIGFIFNEHSDTSKYEEKQEKIISALIVEGQRKWLEKRPEYLDQERKVFRIGTLCTIPEFTGKGIATKLIMVALNYAKELKFDIVFAEATAIESQYMFPKKFNFEIVVEVIFTEFEFNGEKVFKNLTSVKSLMMVDRKLNTWDIIKVNECV